MSTGSVSVLLLRPLLAALEVAHHARFFAATDLTAEIIGDAEARVSPAQLTVAWAEALRLTGNPRLALAIAEHAPPGMFGVVEYVCRAAPTVGEALRQWVRYLNILDDSLEVGLVGDAMRVIQEREAPTPAAHELCFALLVANIRRLASRPFRALAVEFTHSATGPIDAYRSFFAAPVRFAAAETQLVLSAETLATPLHSADPGLLAILARHADELLARKPAGPPLTAQVRRHLRQALADDRAQIEDLARTLGTTARTLQRRLKDEGTAFNALREEVRRDLASHYLAGDLAISEISFLLGFSEPSAFFRAHKRWTGKTPLEVRRLAT